MTKKIAKFISFLFDPAPLAILILIVAIVKSPMSYTEELSWIIGIIILNGFIPFLFLQYFTKRGLVFDDVLKNEAVHRQRIQMFIVFLAIVTVEFFILISTKQYQPLLAVFTGGMIAIALATVISYYWKISLHSAMITFFVAMIIFIFGSNMWPFVFLIPLVGWSRIYLRRHTIWQIIGGFLLALIVVTGTFFLYKLI